MAISYNKLWKLLVDRKMSKADLRKAAGIAPNTMTRLRRDEEVTLTVLNKICTLLNVNIGDIRSRQIAGNDEILNCVCTEYDIDFLSNSMQIELHYVER